jgi:hypothetical protein
VPPPLTAPHRLPRQGPIRLGRASRTLEAELSLTFDAAVFSDTLLAGIVSSTGVQLEGIPTPGDGRCGAWAIAYALHGSFDDANVELIRTAARDLALTMTDEQIYAATYADLGEELAFGAEEQRELAAARDSFAAPFGRQAWITEFGLALIARALNIRIVVHQRDVQNGWASQTFGSTLPETARTIQIVNRDGVHFEALVPAQEHAELPRAASLEPDLEEGEMAEFNDEDFDEEHSEHGVRREPGD